MGARHEQELQAKASAPTEEGEDHSMCPGEQLLQWLWDERSLRGTGATVPAATPAEPP